MLVEQSDLSTGRMGIFLNEGTPGNRNRIIDGNEFGVLSSPERNVLVRTFGGTFIIRNNGTFNASIANMAGEFMANNGTAGRWSQSLNFSLVAPINTELTNFRSVIIAGELGFADNDNLLLSNGSRLFVDQNFFATDGNNIQLDNTAGGWVTCNTLNGGNIGLGV
ncbi:MAG: hypothetical protein AAF840_10950, partial [Bacteroidota bacterium]